MKPSRHIHVDCYPDADFAGLYNHEDSQDPHCVRSRTGYVILVSGCPILWKSKLQTEIALSTMEAEYVSLSQACKDLFPLLDLIKSSVLHSIWTLMNVQISMLKSTKTMLAHSLLAD
jgi:hypothetical protein